MGSMPDSIASTKAEPTITPSTNGSKRTTSLLLLTPNPAQTGIEDKLFNGF